MRAIAAALVILAAAPAAAEDYPECAKIQEALAYNACLARHGPAGRATVAVPDPGGGAGVSGVHGSRVFVGGPRGRVHSTFNVVGRRGGRMSAVFDVGPHKH